MPILSFFCVFFPDTNPQGAKNGRDAFFDFQSASQKRQRREDNGNFSKKSKIFWFFSEFFGFLEKKWFF